jgi:ketosteroid isomerase-like protein
LRHYVEFRRPTRGYEREADVATKKSKTEQTKEPVLVHPNAKLVWSFYEILRERRFDDALELLDDDGIYFPAAGGPDYEEWPLSAWKARLRLLEEGVLKTPTGFVLVHAVTEGDWVYMEMRNDGELDGKPYGQIYSVLHHVSDGKIDVVRQYSDTAYANQLRPDMGTRSSEVHRRLREIGYEGP